MKMKIYFLLFAAGFANTVVGYDEGDKIYAQIGDVDLGYGTTVHEGVAYAFQAPPGEKWYISNANGTDAPHWKYLPNVKTSEVNMTKAGADAEDGLLDKRQRPPAYINYYNMPYCNDFDSQNKPVTLNRCVWSRSLVAWGSSFTPAPFNCRLIVNYYNSGCGFDAACGGYISQTIDLAGCYTPSRIFCATYTTCCLSGC